MTVTRVENGTALERAADAHYGEVLASTILRQFAADGQAAMAMAMQVAPTPFVPTSYKKDKNGWYTPERVAQNVAAAWLAGDEIGLRPMQSLQAIDIIEGRPALNALAMRALVQSHGHEIWVEEALSEVPTQEARITVAGKRSDSDKVQRATWTWARARAANLVGKTNWQNHLIAMLTARATSECCRLIAADVLMGLAYSVEELQDEDPTLNAPAVVKPLRRRDVATTAPAGDPVEPTPGGPLPVPEEPEETDVPGDEPVEDPNPVVPPGHEPGPAPEPPGGQPATAECEEPKADGTAVCNRPAGHDGRHYYGRPVGQGGELMEPVRHESEVPVSEGGETPRPAVGDFEPTEEEVEDQFAEPTEEELTAAFEEELAEREAHKVPEAAQEPVEAVVEGQSRVQAQEAAGAPSGVPAAETQPALGEGDDDPWADFK